METYNLDDYKYDNTSNAPAVYVGTYRKCNNGSLDGMWLDITSFCDYEEFMDVCAYLHRDEDDPELMFLDWDNVPEDWRRESCFDEDTFDKIREWAELDSDKQEAFEAFMNAFCEDDIQLFMDRYEGQYDSMEDFARDLVESTGLLTLPRSTYVPNEVRAQFEEVAKYFDFATYAEELEYDYTWEDGYVFRNY